MMKTIADKVALKKVYFSVLRNNIQKNGINWVIRKLMTRGLKEVAWILLLPFAISLHLAGVRRLLIRVEHIGHLAAEFDAHIKEQQLGLAKKHRFYFVLAPHKKVSNVHLLNYWQPYVNITTHPLACFFLKLLTYRYFVRCDVSRYVSTFFGTQDIYRINTLWGDRPPLLSLTPEDEAWGTQQLAQLGIPKNQWYVCVHVREGGFLPHNELIQSHRNASILNAMPAIEEIIKRGGMVVRMGDPSMSPLPAMPGVIDYALHPLKSARMDVILCAKAKFFLGCTSGLFFLSMIFGVPVAQVNMIPVEALAVRPQDISIPKLLWSDAEKSLLTFNEILSSPIGGFYFTNQYQAANIRLIENTPEDILDITCEMLDRLEGKLIEREEDLALHAKYLSLFKPGHYSYGANSKVCLAFLRKHQLLLE